MKKEIKNYIKELDNYKIKHNFKYSDIASKLDTTTRTLRRWIREGYIPLPVFQNKIKQLINKWKRIKRNYDKVFKKELV